jgi:putative transposase
MRAAYKVRAYPDPEQAAILARTFGCVRVVWNRTLAARHARYQAEGKGTSYRESDAALTAMKKLPDLAWLNEVSSVPLQQTLRHQHQAFGAFFAKRARYPRFKSRQGRQSATYTRAAFRWRDGQLTLAKTSAPLRFVWSWPDIDPATLDPSTVTVCRDPAGRWFIVLHAEVPGPAPLPATGQNVGVDLGLKDFAVLSTGAHIPHPGHMERHERRMKRYQRRLARRQNGSANRAKARVKVARVHARITDRRRGHLHKLTTRLIRENHTLARAISDASWAELRAMLEYKADWYGRTVIAVDRWYPSSKTCSACGHLADKMPLNIRDWVCASCGTRHDRDVNAAKVLCAAGLAVQACGDGVRPSRT